MIRVQHNAHTHSFTHKGHFRLARYVLRGRTKVTGGCTSRHRRNANKSSGSNQGLWHREVETLPSAHLCHQTHLRQMGNSDVWLLWQILWLIWKRQGVSLNKNRSVIFIFVLWPDVPFCLSFHLFVPLFRHVCWSSSSLKHQVSICLSTNACANFHGFGAVRRRQSDKPESY